MNRDKFIRLYKYRALSEPYGRKAAENIILHHRMHWQSPSSFNDPFDCDPVLIFGENQAERREWIKRANASNRNSTSRVQRRIKKRELESKLSIAHANHVKSIWRDLISNTSVSCFSAIGDSQLMWGHYANSHKGVCFVFEEQLWRGEPWIGLDVNYSQNRPIVNLARIREVEIMQKALLNKSSAWSYEHEHRMIAWNEKPGIKQFPDTALKGIILGARIENNDLEFILDLTRRRPHLKVWQALCDDRQFALNIVEF